MKPKEIEPTDDQQAQVEARGYRQFLTEHADGSQQLITVYHLTSLVELATRPDRWASWSAPVWFQEIWD